MAAGHAIDLIRVAAAPLGAFARWPCPVVDVSLDFWHCTLLEAAAPLFPSCSNTALAIIGAQFCISE